MARAKKVDSENKEQIELQDYKKVKVLDYLTGSFGVFHPNRVYIVGDTISLELANQFVKDKEAIPIE